MARLVFGMNQSLDGYVDHDAFGPDAVLFRHFIDQVRGQAGSLYGRRLYEVMRYWDQDDPAWSAENREFAEAWRAHPKWVVSRTLTSVGPNATLISDDVEKAVRKLKAEVDGEIEVGGPEPGRPGSHRRLSDLPAPCRHRRRQALLRRPPTPAPARGPRAHRRRGDPSDLRPGLGSDPRCSG